MMWLAQWIVLGLDLLRFCCVPKVHGSIQGAGLCCSFLLTLVFCVYLADLGKRVVQHV